MKRQAMSELQKAVSDAERKAHELISTERAKMERALAEARRQASEDALSVVNQQEDSSEVGLPAHPTPCPTPPRPGPDPHSAASLPRHLGQPGALSPRGLVRRALCGPRDADVEIEGSRGQVPPLPGHTLGSGRALVETQVGRHRSLRSLSPVESGQAVGGWGPSLCWGLHLGGLVQQRRWVTLGDSLSERSWGRQRSWRGSHGGSLSQGPRSAPGFVWTRASPEGGVGRSGRLASLPIAVAALSADALGAEHTDLASKGAARRPGEALQTADGWRDELGFQGGSAAVLSERTRRKQEVGQEQRGLGKGSLPSVASGGLWGLSGPSPPPPGRVWASPSRHSGLLSPAFR